MAPPRRRVQGAISRRLHGSISFRVEARRPTGPCVVDRTLQFVELPFQVVQHRSPQIRASQVRSTEICEPKARVTRPGTSQISVDEADEIYELRAVLDEFVGRRVAKISTPAVIRELHARVEGFIELSQMMDAPGAAAGLPEDMLPRVHTKTLLLAWAFDETYGFLSALGRGEA